MKIRTIKDKIGKPKKKLNRMKELQHKLNQAQRNLWLPELLHAVDNLYWEIYPKCSKKERDDVERRKRMIYKWILEYENILKEIYDKHGLNRNGN